MIFDPIKVLLRTALVDGVSPNLREALQAISAEMIPNELYGDIYNAVMAIDRFNASVTLESVAGQLEDTRAFWEVAEVTKDVWSTNEPMRQANEIINAYNDKNTVQTLAKILEQMQSGKVFDRSSIADSLGLLSANITPVADNKPVRFSEYAENYMDVLDSRISGKSDSILDIGLDVDIDKTSLVVLGGLPGNGKTALALFILDFVASQGKPVLKFSLEMDGGQLFERQVGAKSGVSTRDLRRLGKDGFDLNDYEWSMVSAGLAQINDLPIYIDDNPKLTVPLFAKKCRDFKNDNPDLAMIAIDYLTLMEMPDASTRALSVGEATRQLKLLAKELKTPILLLSQLNREADKEKRPPRNSDLRDSGAIEQDADVILFPYREEVHHPETPNFGMAKVLKTKVRNGTVGEHILEFKAGGFFQTDKQWITQQIEPPKQRQKF